jgi:hypothetical protein
MIALRIYRPLSIRFLNPVWLYQKTVKTTFENLAAIHRQKTAIVITFSHDKLMDYALRRLP